MRRAAIVSLIAAAAAVTLAAAPPQEQAYRSATNLVSVFATVTDSTGRLVTDLQQSDFEVKDNGRTQPLTVFSNEKQPFTSVVMLDRSGSMAEHFELVANGASRFVKELMPEDRVRIGSFGNQISIRPEAFTGDQEKLIHAIDNQPRELGASPVWGAIDRSISALLPAEGRRVVLIFSDGHNNPRRGQSFVDVDDLIRRARYDGIMIYAIGFWEIEQASSGPATTTFPPRTPVQYPFPWGRPAPKPSKPPASFKLPGGSKGTPPDPALKELAKETAGGYFELSLTQDLAATFARVADELHRQYWLGFAPVKMDGKTHKLEVKVKRPGVKVRARETYVAK